MPFHSTRPRLTCFRSLLPAVLLLVATIGCRSKQQAAEEAQIAQARQQAASTGQPQQVVSIDKDGNTVTTIVQPPAAGQKDEVVTTTVTPKSAAASQGAASQNPPGTDPSAAQAGTNAQPAVPAPPPPITVAAGTGLAIRVDQRISAKGSSAGDKFTGELVEPVADGNGQSVIPKGSRVRGVVVAAQGRGDFKGAADLKLRLTTLTLNGKEYSLETRAVIERKKGKGKRTGAFVGGGAGLGLLLGGIAGGGRGALIGGLAGAGAGTAGAGLTGNRDLVIPAESIVHFKLADDLTIDP